jgi:hypothetical protein
MTTLVGRFRAKGDSGSIKVANSSSSHIFEAYLTGIRLHSNAEEESGTQMQSNLTSYVELTLGIVGIVLALYERSKRKADRDELHRQLVVLKPSIQGQNKDEVVRVLDDTLERLRPSKK